MFKKASKEGTRARLALIGPSGSGKTYTALNIAKHLGGTVALIDTERKSARKYAPPKGQKPRKHEFEFDDGNLSKFGPEDYIEAIQEAGKLKYHTLIIDSLSHAWFGVGGELELVDNAAKRMKDNRYYAWRDVTPLHNKLVDTILRSSCHIIATMRAKTTYEIIRDEKGSFL